MTAREPPQDNGLQLATPLHLFGIGLLRKLADLAVIQRPRAVPRRRALADDDRDLGRSHTGPPKLEPLRRQRLDVEPFSETDHGRSRRGTPAPRSSTGDLDTAGAGTGSPAGPKAVPLRSVRLPDVRHR